ncbi:MAG TPA: hypothetical protein VEY71_09275 [Chitinophagales bacterium]|nr:hypothetical protein [Chitinophagales bacterium]
MSPATPSLKNYFLNYFEFNLITNCVLLKKVEELPDPTHAFNAFADLIMAHRGWLRCLTTTGCAHEPLPARNVRELKGAWKQIVNGWVEYLSGLDVPKLQSQLLVVCLENGETVSTTVRDIAFQLNSQSVLVREQIARMMRQQGCTPPHTEAVFSALDVMRPVRLMVAAR